MTQESEGTTKVRAEHQSLKAYLEANLSGDERQRIGLISFNQWTFALGAVMETALEACSLGSEVTIAFWSDETPLPDPGWRASRWVAHLVGSKTKDERAQEALEAVGFDPGQFARPPLRGWSPDQLPAVPRPATRRSIRELTYKGSDMGRSLLQVHPDDQTPIRDSHVWPATYVAKAMESYAWVFDQATALMRERGITTVVVYNGRFTHDRAVAAAAEQLGIRVLYYDTGGYETDFDLTTATTHDWADLQVRMKRMFNQWDPQERVEIGSRWFINRQTHADTNNRVFTGTQTRGLVEGVPEADRVVVFFSSSGDEIAEMDLDWDEYLQSQENALATLAAACRQRPGTALVVRTHPHMRLKPADDLADWMAAVESAGPDVHFDPFSPVDSYALMDLADVVFTYGSTAGVESAFFGRPVVVMGPSAYDTLGCATRIRDGSRIPELIGNPPQPHPDAALPYGLMMERRGFNFTHIDGREESASLGGVRLSEASDWALKLSDYLHQRRTRRLMRK